MSVIGEQHETPGIQKYFSSHAKVQENSKTSDFFPIGKIETVCADHVPFCKTIEGMRSMHPGLFEADWSPLITKLDCIFQTPKNNQGVVCQLLGEFSSLFINIMPFERGSASICEWLMHAVAKHHDINLGVFNTSNLSWDFSAFFNISPTEYGKNFSQFFKPEANQAELNRPDDTKDKDPRLLKSVMELYIKTAGGEMASLMEQQSSEVFFSRSFS